MVRKGRVEDWSATDGLGLRMDGVRARSGYIMVLGSGRMLLTVNP